MTFTDTARGETMPGGPAAGTRSGTERAGRRRYHPLPVEALSLWSGRQAREDRDYYVPDLLADSRYRPGSGLYAAAEADCAGLRQAMAQLDEATNLVAVLRGYLETDGSRLSMRTDTVLGIVQKRLERMRDCVDRHDTRHTNLFLAYFELKRRLPDEE